MKFAFIMDPLDGVNAYKDTTYYLMLAAHRRGHDVYYLDQRELFVSDAELRARAQHVEVHADVDHPFTTTAPRVHDLSAMDAVFVRTDPPVDRRYIYTTLLLDLLPQTTRIVNPTAALRDWNEKLAALFFPEICPVTQVLRDSRDIVEFAKTHDRVILKPIDGHGGKGIEFVRRDDHDAGDKINRVTREGRHWIIAQAYLSEADDGDRRVLLLNGKPLGAVLRVHGAGSELNNLDAGGSALATDLSDRDVEICERIAPSLIEKGIVFCGIDIIGGKLIEINITSPTCLQELCRFSGVDHHHAIIAALEA